MSDFNSLSPPEKLVVKRLSFDEPFPIINAWLLHNDYNQITEEGLEKLKIKHHGVVKELKSIDSGDSIFKELVDIKDFLISTSSETKDPKAISQLSNSINSISKTITDFVEKKRAEKEDDVAGPDEFLNVLKFLKSEGLIDFTEENFNGLRKNLLETISSK